MYNRTVIGVIAVLLLLGGGRFWWDPPERAAMQQLMSACLRLGPVLLLWWLAYPQAKSLPAWLAAAIPVLVIILAVRPRWIIIALPILIAYFVLKKRT